MPILWRYLLSHYFKVLILCVVSFIAILLTTRLDEIAHFVTLGPSPFFIFLFILYQIPYILPIAFPIAALISAILLIQRLSRTHELTACRAAGIGLGTILAPILIAAGFLSLANFYIVSELSTQSHLSSGLIKNELRSVNPLLLLHNKHLMKMKGIFFNTLGPSKLGETANSVIIAMPDKVHHRINLMVAEGLQASPTTFSGHEVTLLSSSDKHDSTKGNKFIVENMEEITTTLEDFGQLMQKKVWNLNNDHLKMPFLLNKLAEEKQVLQQAKANQVSLASQKEIKRKINRIYTEMQRRISVAMAVFTFTLMGAAFGLSISRRQSSRGLFIVIALAAFYLISFFVAKGIDHLFEAASVLYLLPHLIIIVLSIHVIRKIGKGIE